MIDEYTYGCFKADGKEFLGDLRIKNNVAHYWEGLEGRKLKIEHINELLKEKPDVFVIGTGAGAMLEVDEEIRKFLISWKINSPNRPIAHVVKNVEAVKLINSAIMEGKRVCAVLPGGC